MEVTQLPFPLSSLQSVHQARNPEMLHKWQPSGAVVNPEAVEVSGVFVEAEVVAVEVARILRPEPTQAVKTPPQIKIIILQTKVLHQRPQMVKSLTREAPELAQMSQITPVLVIGRKAGRRLTVPIPWSVAGSTSSSPEPTEPEKSASLIILNKIIY